MESRVESAADCQQLHTRLLVTLAQMVLVMHQTSYVPARLREQLTRQIAELETLTERYAAYRSVDADRARASLKLVEPLAGDRPPDPAA